MIVLYVFPENLRGYDFGKPKMKFNGNLMEEMQNFKSQLHRALDRAAKRPKVSESIHSYIQ